MEQVIVHDYGSNLSECGKVIYEDPSENKDVSQLEELFTGESLIELCNSYWKSSPSARKNVQPYLRGCKWSPDGTCCLSVVNHDGFHIMELPRDLYDRCPTRDRMTAILPAVIHIKESGLVYDFCWYPKMNSHCPETCCWISTKKNSPIQMWDAYDGSLRCSYRGYNAVDEMEPAISVMFINQGQTILGGYKNCLRTFDVERPGRDFLEHKIKSPASCIATIGNLLAIGSWSANIQLFSIFNNGTYRSVGNLHAHTGGITHLQFTPDGTKLVSGARKDHNLCVWDTRYYRRPLNILKRCVSTNQRIYFDISSCGRYLVSGGTDGIIRVWDNKLTKWTEQFNVKHANQESATFRFRLHRDCVNSISIHPTRPIIATGSGQYHILDPVKALEDESDNGSSCGMSIEESQIAPKKNSFNEQTPVYNANMYLPEVLKTVSKNAGEIHTQDVRENTSKEVLRTAAAKDLPIKIPDQRTEESPSEIIALQTSGEPPPAKKPKWSNHFNSPTPTEIIDTETPVSISNMEICNNLSSQANIHDAPPNMKCKVDASKHSFTEVTNRGDLPIEDEDLSNELVIDTIDKPTSQATEDVMSPHAKGSNVIATKQPSDSQDSPESKSNDSAIASIVINNYAIPSPSKLNKYSEATTFPNKESYLTSTDEPYSNSELTTLSKSDTFDKSSLRIIKVDDDDDNNDANENNMKYLSYAENNMTFWWIGNVSTDNLHN